MKRLLVLIAALAASPAFAQTAPLRLNGVQFKGLSVASGTGTTSNPIAWVDLSTQLRLSDGTNNLYVPACAPSVSGQVCSWNGTSWTASSTASKLQAVYNAGANINDSVITIDSTRRGIVVADSVAGDAFQTFAVTNNGGSTPYLQVKGAGASSLRSPKVGAVLVYPGIDAANAAPLLLGTGLDSNTTAGVFIGNQSPGPNIATTVQGSLTVAGLTNLTGGVQVGHLILSPTGLTADRTFTFPDATDTVDTIAAAQTLTNKTLTAPVMAGGLTASGSSAYNFSGSTGGFSYPTGAVSGSPSSYSMTPTGVLTLTAAAASTWAASGGLTIGTSTLNALNFNMNGATQWSIDTSGNFVPSADSVATIGSPSIRVNFVYAREVISGGTTATDTSGTILHLNGSDAGPASAATGKVGGNINLNPGAGSAGSASFAGGVGGALNLSSGAGGVSGGAGAGANGQINFQINSATKASIDANGNLIPSVDNGFRFGSSALRWQQAWSFSYGGATQSVAAATSTTLTCTSGESIRLTLGATAITSLTMASGLIGEVCTVEVVEDATGSRTVPTTWTNVKFAGGTYTATTTANKRDVLTFRYDTTDSVWVEVARAMNE